MIEDFNHESIGAKVLATIRGMSHPYPIYQYGGTSEAGKPVIVLALANGFPPQTYQPLMEPFTDRFRVLCLLPRPLWQPTPDPEGLHTWVDMADDLLAGMRAHELTNVIAVGHSMGGVASMLAVIREPSRFRALILLDPTIFPPFMLRAVWVMRQMGLSHRFPLVQKTKRRRRTFADLEEAYTYFRSRALFRDWSDDLVRLYTEGLMRPSGTGFELAWTPEWEARFYRTLYADSWRQIPKLRGLLPILALRGQMTDTFLPTSARKFQHFLPQAALHEISGHGHLFPQSAPEITRTLIEGWLQKLPNG